MNVLVTGGAGFLGSSLVDRLIAEDHNVDVIDNLSTGSLGNLYDARAQRTGTLKIHQCDIREEGLSQLIVRRDPDVVYHLATTTAPGSLLEASSVDLVGTMHVLHAAIAAGARKIVVAGRVAAGTVPGLGGVAERAIGDLVMGARHAAGIEATVLEFATVYGPRQRPGTAQSVVATFADRLRHGLPCVIHGSGEQRRDLVFVDDAVDALCRAADAADGLTIEVGTGTQVSIAELYQAMAAVAGTDEPPVPGAGRPDEREEVAADPARASLYLGWRWFTDLAAGLAATVDVADQDT